MMWIALLLQACLDLAMTNVMLMYVIPWGRKLYQADISN